MWTTYLIIAVLLVVAELVYFKIADKCNIIDKPNERSSHKMIVLRGGGIIFTIALWVWSVVFGFQYPWLLAGVTLMAGVSFIDDIHSLRFSFRLVIQFVAMTLILGPCIAELPYHWAVKVVITLIALFFAVWGTNMFNFMDGINGITGGYSLAMLIPLQLLNMRYGFMEESLLVVVGLSLLVFCFFNFRTKAKCFAGDVGSIGIAGFLSFCLCKLMVQTGDITWIVFYLVYGADGGLTILHRVLLHENIGKPHRKHAYQLMANELKMRHVVVSTIYMVMQLAVSLIAIYVVPDSIAARWVYLLVCIVLIVLAYYLFMKKYYHLHEAYLASLKKVVENNEHNN